MSPCAFLVVTLFPPGPSLAAVYDRRESNTVRPDVVVILTQDHNTKGTVLHKLFHCNYTAIHTENKLQCLMLIAMFPSANFKVLKIYSPINPTSSV